MVVYLRVPVGFPTMGVCVCVGGVSDSCLCLGSFPPPGLPCTALICRFIVSYKAIFSGYHWEACSFFSFRRETEEEKLS